jgi:hypothetical protein
VTSGAAAVVLHKAAAMMSVAVRIITLVHYHFVIALWSVKEAEFAE